MRQVLVISALVSLSTAELCFDQLEVAAACTAGSAVGPRQGFRVFFISGGEFYTMLGQDKGPFFTIFYISLFGCFLVLRVERPLRFRYGGKRRMFCKNI